MLARRRLNIVELTRLGFFCIAQKANPLLHELVVQIVVIRINNANDWTEHRSDGPVLRKADTTMRGFMKIAALFKASQEIA